MAGQDDIMAYADHIDLDNYATQGYIQPAATDGMA